MWVNSPMDRETAFVEGRRPPPFGNFFIYQDRRMKFDRHIVLRTGLVERGGGEGRGGREEDKGGGRRGR